MWGGHSCPPAFDFLVFSFWFALRFGYLQPNFNLNLNIKVNSGGQECPPHTFLFVLSGAIVSPIFYSARRTVKGNPKVIAVLSQVLKAELTAINQYFLHAEMCENWGYEKLAKHTRVESIEEMQHAEKLIEHILYLDGTPNMSDYFKINIGQNVKAQLEFDLQVEYEAVKRLNEGIETCVKAGDNGSRDLLQGILTDEEEHIDWLEGQLHAISEMGLPNYLAQQLHEEKE
jgi:bacterioferritin